MGVNKNKVGTCKCVDYYHDEGNNKWVKQVTILFLFLRNGSKVKHRLCTDLCSSTFNIKEIWKTISWS